VRRGLIAAAITATFGVLGAAPSQAAGASSPVCKPHGAPKATVIVILGGGFVWPGWADTTVCRALAKRGFRAINLVYPLHDLPGAVRATTRAARTARRRKLPVFAFGLSAGGTLAELAAVTGRVDAAVALAAPTDLLHWAPGGPIAGQQWDSPAAYWRDVGATRAQRRAASPLRRVSKRAAPLLLFHSSEDEVVPIAQARALVHRLRHVKRARLRVLRGKHLQSQAFRSPAFRWLGRRLR
jgi:acetyl esterase/lipase